MKKIRYSLALTALFCFLSVHSQAQMNMGIQFKYMEPMQDYGENLSRSPMGIGMSFLVPAKFTKKFYFGVQAGVSMFATDDYKMELLSGEKQGEEIRIDEEDCFLNYSIVGRYYFLEKAMINPYVEGRLGGLSFFSTKLAEEDYREYYDSKTTFHGTSFQTGIGGGLVVHALENISFDLGFIYNQGTKTNYRNIEPFKDTYRLNPDDGKFNSYIHNLDLSLGVLFGF